MDLLDKENCKNFKLRILFVVMSVIVNLLQNCFACYVKLGHFKEALKCADYIKQL